MHYKVKALRTRGARRSDREISADAGVDGQLAGAHIGPIFELKLFSDDGSRMEPLIPVLLDAKLISMHGNKMLFRGFEQPGADGPQYAQEWSVMVVVGSPNVPAERMG